MTIYEKEDSLIINSDFSIDSSAWGLKRHEFDNLDPIVKKKLIKLISRISERSYRRAVQQVLTLKDNIDDWIQTESYDYRYGKSLSVSIGLDGFTTSSQERLLIEEPISELFGIE